MRSKKFIVGIIVVLIAILGVMVALFLFSPGQQPPADEQPFGSTTATRDVPFFSIDDLQEPERFEGSQSAPADVPRLRLIARQPVSGAGISGDAVRFVEKATGAIQSTPLAQIGAVTTLSSQTIRRTIRTIWSPDGSAALLLRVNDSADTVFSYLAILSASSSEGLVGRPLLNNIRSAAFSPSSDAVAYLVPGATGGSVLYVEDVHEELSNEVWSSPLTDLSVGWGGAGIVVYTNASDVAEGVAWRIDPTSHASSILIGHREGLSVLADPYSKRLAYSYREENGVLALQTYDVTSGEEVSLPHATLAEKCAWGGPETTSLYCAVPRKQYNRGDIDKLYRGDLTQDDTIWWFDTESGASSEVVDLLNETNVQMGVVDPVVTPNSSFFIFRTPVGDSLWSLKLP